MLKAALKLPRILRLRNHVLSVEWGVTASPRFFALNLALKLAIVGLLLFAAAGLTCLATEITLWSHRTFALTFSEKRNRWLRTELDGRLREQARLFQAVDSIAEVEGRIRSLYGMNRLDRAFLRMGTGGPRSAQEIFTRYHHPLEAEVAECGQTLERLETRLTLSEGNLRQIQDFIHYRMNLWEHTPSVMPARGELTSGFGYRLHPVTGQVAKHEGLDIANARWTPIYAPAAGMVLEAGESGFFGNLVVLDHGNGYTTKFGHLSRVAVVKGQLVKRYALIGYMGMTGRATGVHLHYEVHRDGAAQDPARFILPSGLVVD